MIFTKINSKQKAMDLFKITRREFLDYSRWVARKICKQKGHVTVDDIRELVQLPKGLDGRCYGGIFIGKEWIKTGYTHTTIRSSHGRPIAVFSLA